MADFSLGFIVKSYNKYGTTYNKKFLIVSLLILSVFFRKGKASKSLMTILDLIYSFFVNFFKIILKQSHILCNSLFDPYSYA